jgi:hypothetical protein
LQIQPLPPLLMRSCEVPTPPINGGLLAIASALNQAVYAWSICNEQHNDLIQAVKIRESLF